MFIFKIILICVISYFIGAIPNGYLLAKYVYKIDIQEKGNKNIGASNMLIVIGLFPAVFTFLLDALVGFVPVMIAKALTPSLHIWVLSGVFAVFGHNYSIYMKNFKGGRGVATTFGVGLAINPLINLISLGVFLLVVSITKYGALGSIISISVAPFLIYIFKKDLLAFLLSFLFPILIIISHWKNICALVKGTEVPIDKLIKIYKN